MKKLTLAALIASLALAAQAAPFKVGSMSGQEADLVKAAAKVAKEKHNLDVEIVEFDDYVAPNVALADGSIDANAFQHKPYLDVMVKDRGLKLVPVGNTFVYPIGAYSKKIKDIKELKDGATIGLPGDPSNEGRSLILLEKQGLIKLKDSKNLESTVLDIAENPHNYKFSEVDASLVPNSLPDVDLAFINSNYAINADLLPKRDALILEDPDSPYVNIIVVREADKVKDRIIFDRAHGQSGTASKGGGIITRNVDARLFTAQAYARYNFNPHWAAGIKATYNYGHNETDGRPLYQIRPFEAAVQADYKNYFAYGSYNIGAATRFVAKQTRGDFDAASGLGIDKREAAKGFTVADLYAGVNIKDKYGLRLGVNNVFNKKYAEHISGDHVLALSPSVVYAPGRTYWLSLHAAF